jgi:pentatricopeptide repeat protein
MRDPASALITFQKSPGDDATELFLPGSQNAGREEVAQRLGELLREGRFEAVFGCFAEAQRRGIVPDWAISDRVATTMLHLGQPADARQIWARAADAPSPAVRQSRIATAALASQDFQAAREGYESALKLDSGLGEAWFGLALLHAQLGEAKEALAACEGALRQSLTPAQVAALEVFQKLIAPHRPQ